MAVYTTEERAVLDGMQNRINGMQYTLTRICQVLENANFESEGDMRELLAEIAQEVGVVPTRDVSINVTLEVEVDQEVSINNQIVEFSASSAGTVEFNFSDIISVSAFVTNEDVEDALSREDSWECGSWGSSVVEVKSVSVEDA